MILKNYFKWVWEYNKRKRQAFIIGFAAKYRDEIGHYLDLGCDDGGFTKKIAKASGSRPFGIEINEKRGVKARKRGIIVKNTDLNEKFPYKSDYFDLITADQVIEHLVDVDSFVSEIKRVLKPKGKLVICTENLASWHNIFALMLGIQPFTGPDVSSKYPVGFHPIGPKNSKESMYKTNLEDLENHKGVMTYKSLVKLFRAHKFRNVRGYGFGYIPLPPIIGDLLGNINKSHSQFILITAENKK
ncbi:class I SAM-dependent methyltransferase [Patescibacteria group bacterium]